MLFNTTFDRRIFDISSPRNAIKGQFFSRGEVAEKSLKCVWGFNEKIVRKGSRVEAEASRRNVVGLAFIILNKHVAGALALNLLQ